MNIPNFNLARLPRIEFGAGCLARLPACMARYGHRALLVTGAHSFRARPHWPQLIDTLEAQGTDWHAISIPGEPSPQEVDAAVAQYRTADIAVVVGIGGGSALDAAKAIAGLLRPGNSVLDHLEGVGPELPYRGPATPFIAVPTTAGTGSEATKNAVLSTHGANGYKKSFRDEALVAEWAFIDPNLLTGCPKAVLAANGMDALTQLLESLVSTKANPFTDALALSGLATVRESLLPWYAGEGDTAAHQSRMAYAALLSGITLAQVGLGSVHGLASPLGAFFPIPHGAVCGTLVAEATRVNLTALRARAPGSPALEQYTHAAHALGLTAVAALPDLLADWCERLALPRLSHWGVTAADIQYIVAHSRGSSMKTNPIVLTDTEIATILATRL